MRIMKFISWLLRRRVSLECPYTKEACTEYDSGSATLLTECEDCKNYRNGVRASKF